MEIFKLMNKLIEKSKKELELEKSNQSEKEIEFFKNFLRDILGDDCLDHIEIVDSRNARFVGTKYGVQLISFHSSPYSIRDFDIFLRDSEYRGAYTYEGFGPIRKLSDLSSQISLYETQIRGDSFSKNVPRTP